jgi:predicted Zn-ribbon and HTH transcriptional regulator
MLKVFQCLKCGHDWASRSERPTICPKCKSAYWDRPKTVKAKAQAP